MRELMLIENPQRGRGRRGRNPVYVAPYSYYKSSVHKRVHVPGYVKRFPGERNPQGGNIMRNTMGVRTISKQWFQGVALMEAGAALGGLAMSTMLPGMFVRDTATTGQKWLKIGASALTAIGAGWVFQNVSPTAGKYAVAGGLAGTLQQALAAFGIVTIGKKPMGGLHRRLGEANLISPSTNRGDETVSVIIP